MNLESWLAIGVLAGLLRSAITKGATWKTAVLDASLGVVGAVPWAWFLLPLSGTTDPRSVHVSGLVGALLGAVALLAVGEIFRP